MKFILTYIIIGISFLSAQTNGTFNQKKLDTSNILIEYDFLFLKDSLKKDRKTYSIKQLFIGENYSVFGDMYLFKSDSILKLAVNNNTHEYDDVLLETYLSIKNKDYIIKNNKNNNYIFQSKVYTYNFQFEEELPKLKWTLENERMDYNGYNLKKAKTYYGGREWIAWYCEEVPFNNGPYLFNNLPGLIFIIKDKDENFNYKLTSIKKIEKEITIRDDESIIKTDKKSFIKTNKNYHNNPDIFVNTKSYDSPNVESNLIYNKKIPYNPIELE